MADHQDGIKVFLDSFRNQFHAVDDTRVPRGISEARYQFFFKGSRRES